MGEKVDSLRTGRDFKKIQPLRLPWKNPWSLRGRGSSSYDFEPVKERGVQISDIPCEILLKNSTPWDEAINHGVQSWFRGGCVPSAWTQSDVTVWVDRGNAVAV